MVLPMCGVGATHLIVVGPSLPFLMPMRLTLWSAADRKGYSEEGIFPSFSLPDVAMLYEGEDTSCSPALMSMEPVHLHPTKRVRSSVLSR